MQVQEDYQALLVLVSNSQIHLLQWEDSVE
jgi:hypothetical protein